MKSASKDRPVAWRPVEGEECLFTKSGSRVRVTELLPRGRFTVERVDTGKAMLVTRGGLAPLAAGAGA